MNSPLRRGAIFVLLVTLQVAVQSAAYADWDNTCVPVCRDTGTQDWVASVSDGDGGAIVTWRDYRSSTYGIYAQRVDRYGELLWELDGVAVCSIPGLSINQGSPLIVADGAGGAVIAWYDSRNGNEDIFAQRINDNGEVQWTANGVEVCTADSAQYTGGLVSDGAGGAILAWTDYRSVESDIYAQRIDSNGTALWASDGIVICDTIGYQGATKIASDGSGGAIAIWSDCREFPGSPYEWEYYDIYAQRINASGAAQWASNGIPICTETGSQSVQSIISDGNNGAIMAWDDIRSGWRDIYAQRIDENGNALWGANGTIICVAAYNQFSPELLLDGPGGAIVTWYDGRNGADADIYAQRLNSDGEYQWTSGGSAICVMPEAQAYQHLVSDGNGGAIISWYGQLGGVPNDIRAQRVDQNGTPQWLTNGVVVWDREEQSRLPVIVSDCNGGAILAWNYEDPFDGWDVYAQRVNHNGTVGQRKWLVKPDGTGDAPTIAAAVDSCAPCDTVLLADGTYEEHDITIQKPLRIHSESGNPAVCTIDCRENGRAFSFSGSGSVPISFIDGITFTNGMSGSTRGGAIRNVNAGLVISNCVFVNNSAPSSYGGGGLYCENSLLDLRDCIIGANSTTGDGGGIKCKRADLSLLGTTIAYNDAASGGGIALEDTCSLIIWNTIIAFNGAEAVSSGELEILDITCSDIYGNAGGDWVGDLSGMDGVSGNISVDPLFCGEVVNPEDPYAIAGDSPCSETNSLCGQIGARGVACVPHTPRTWNVPADAPTIAAAVDSCAYGDTILLADNTYNEYGISNWKSITIRSASGNAATCTIDCQGTDRAFLLHRNAIPPVVRIEGITFENGYGDIEPNHGGGAIRCNEIDSLILSNCIFRNNVTTNATEIMGGSTGGAVQANYSDLLIESCDFIDNKADSAAGGAISCFSNAPHSMGLFNCNFSGNSSTYGGAVVIGNIGDLTIDNCSFSNNSAVHRGGGMWFNTSGDAVISDCSFTGNVAGDQKAGIVIGYSDNVQISYCEFSNHSGSAVFCDLSDSVVISNCGFINNHTLSNGGGVFLRQSNAATISGCDFFLNAADGNYIENNEGGGGLYCEEGSAIVSGCVFAGNSTPKAGGGVFCYRSDLELENTSIVANTGELSGGGIALGDSSSLAMTNSIIAFSGDGEAVSCGEHATADVSCSDIYNNDGGDWIGCLSGLLEINNNIQADPLFCDPNEGDFSVSEASPCNDPPGCGGGTIGARGVGCSPRTWYVPGDFSSIAEAVDGVAVGDTIEVACGTYYEADISITTRGLYLRSETLDPSCVVIDAQQLNGIITCEHAGDTAGPTVIEGFTLRNGSNEGGGGLSITESAVEIRSCIIEDNQGLSYGGGVKCADSDVLFEGCIIRENGCGGGGGGIYCGDANVRLVQCELLENGAAQKGGGIYHEGSELDIQYSIVAYNESQNGGGLYCTLGSTVDIENSTIDDNDGYTDGGGIYIGSSDCSLIFTRSIISYSQGGGAVHCGEPPVMDISCSDIFGNEGGDWAGCLSGFEGVNDNFSENPFFCKERWNPTEPYTVMDSSPCAPANSPCGQQVGAKGIGCSPRFWTVMPDGSGDAPTIQAAVDSAAHNDVVLLGDGTFTGPGNRDIDFKGKAILLGPQSLELGTSVIDCEGSVSDPHRGFYFHTGEDSTSYLFGVTIRNGYATDALPGGAKGGGIFCAQASPEIENCIIEYNHADSSGAGIYCIESFADIDGCSMIGNSAYGSGAGMYSAQGALDIDGCQFIENTAGSHAGAECNGDSTHFDDCRFLRNHSSNNGGGLGVISSFVHILWTVFGSNDAEAGGGAIYCDGSELTIGFMTFADNSAWSGEGGGIRCVGTTLDIEWTIIAFSRGSDAISGESSTVYEFARNDIYGNELGDYVGPIAGYNGTYDNISADPLFCGDLNPDDPYSIHENSPCINYIGARGVGCSNRIWHVPSEAPTISAAVDSCANGDIILLSDGTYEEHGISNWKTIDIKSESGNPATCTIDCQGIDRAFYFYTNAIEPVIKIDGIAFTNGRGGVIPTPSLIVGGGAITANQIDTLMLTNCVFQNNTAIDTVGPYGHASCGGALYIFSTNLIVTDCSFNTNHADINIGAIYCVNHPEHSTTINGCEFYSNSADHVGAVGLDGGACFVDNCTFSSNSATYSGGAILIGENTAAEIIGCSFSGNYAGNGAGAGINCFYADESQISNCTFTEHSGSPVTCHRADSVTISECSFFNNHTTRNGGGVHLEFSNAASILDCSFTDNTADGNYIENNEGGGGLCCEEGSVIVSGCVFGNNATQKAGGGVFCYKSDLELDGTTLVSNNGDLGAGGIALGDSSSLTMTNSIIAYSGAGEAVSCGLLPTIDIACSDIYGNDGGDWVGCITGLEGADGNITDDPLFCGDQINPDDPYTIAPISPCTEANSPCGRIGARGVGCGISPDLHVTNIAVPDSAWSGQGDYIEWTVENAGLAAAAARWKEYVYISDDTLAGGDTKIAEFTYPYDLAPGASYTHVHPITFPQDIEGDRWIVVCADGSGSVDEGGMEANNCLASPDSILVKLTPYPNLVVDSVAVDSTFDAGGPVEVAWTTCNTGGEATTAPLWYDKLYLSPDPEPGGFYLGKYRNRSYLPAGECYLQNETGVNIPMQASNGTYYLVVAADGDNHQDEHHGEGDNYLASDSIVVTEPIRPKPDLAVTNFISPSAGWAGNPIHLSWTVHNDGDAAASATGKPVDWIMISPDSTNDPHGLAHIGGDIVGVPLEPDSQYTKNVDVYLPFDLSGTYYLFVWTDVDLHFEDPEFANNFSAVRRIEIHEPAPADLTVESVSTGGSSVVSGTPIAVSWTVANVGAGPGSVGAWSDAVYLSEDDVLDTEEDVRVVLAYHTGRIEPDSQYSRAVDAYIPGGISGWYYVFVCSDVNGQVDEADENNNCRRTTTQIEITDPPPADLRVTTVDAPAGGWSGTTVDMSWTVRNFGPDPTTVSSWWDHIYISEERTFSAGSSTLLHTLKHTGALQVDGSYAVGPRSVGIPNGYEGLYYIHGYTDYTNVVYEAGNETNNTRLDSLVISLTPPPDLQVTGFSADDTVTAGQQVSTWWTVQNKGTGGTIAASWADRIYLSPDTVLSTGSDYLVKSVSHTGALAPEADYDGNRSVTIPYGYAGDYYLILETDATGTVYEHDLEGNNTKWAPLTVIAPPVPPPPDLAITDLVFVDDLWDTLRCTITNVGAYPTYGNEGSWIDRFYLSPDSTLDTPFDDLIAMYSRSGGLAAGASYELEKRIRLPYGSKGSYYLIGVADATDRVSETADSNNVMCIPVQVELTAPDLVIPNVTGPDSAIAGQPVNVQWTVANTGDGVCDPTTWNDGVYLSRDLILDATDYLLASPPHGGGCDPGGDYLVDREVMIPVGITGAYYFFVHADKNRSVFEYDRDDNNIGHTAAATAVYIPPAEVDLEISAIDVPDSALAGEEVSISWTVFNREDKDLKGQWADAVYISLDDAWDISDPYLGETVWREGLTAGGRYRQTLTVLTETLFDSLETILPGLEPEDYNIVVRSDIFNQINETDELNNTGVSTGDITMDLVPLHFGVEQDSTVAQHGRHYYRLAVSAGQDLHFTVTNDTRDELELYLGFGAIPDRIDYDYKFQVHDSTVMVVPGIPGNCYIMVYGDYVLGSGGYTILAEPLTFGLVDVDPSVAGNAGFVNFSITGGQLADAIAVRLSSPGGSSVDAYAIPGKSSTNVTADFDLRGTEPGMYDMFVYAGQPEPAVMMSAVEIFPGGTQLVEPYISGPAAIRQGASNDYTITLRNASTTDAHDVISSVALTPGLQYALVFGPAEIVMIDVADGEPVFVYTSFIGVGETAPYTLRIWGDKDAEIDAITVFFDPEFTATGSKNVITSSWVGESAEAFLDAIVDHGAVLDQADADEFWNTLADTWDTNDIVGIERTHSTYLGNRIKGAIMGTLDELESGWPDLQSGVEDPAPDPDRPRGVWDLSAPVSLAGIEAAENEAADQYLQAKSSGRFKHKKKSVTVRIARDPNEKYGPTDLGEDFFVSQTDVLPYTVYFENMPDAEATAQQVVITDRLDDDLDWRQFRLGEIAFGDMVVQVPANCSYYHSMLTLDSGYLLEIDAGLDFSAGEVHWLFNTIDPMTGLPPVDPDAGFLPPNDSTQAGAGHVHFTIRAHPDSPDGSEITNYATIVFDANDPIVTRTVVNVLKKTHPDLMIASAAGNTTFPVYYEGEDIVINAVIGNIGEGDAGEFAVSFYDGDPGGGGTVIDEATVIASLDAGAENEVGTIWNPAGGSAPHTIYVTVDPGNTVDEMDETNNVETIEIEVVPRRYTVSFEKGINFVALPLEPEAPYTAGSLAAHIGASMIIRYDRDCDCFVPYIAGDGGENFTIENTEGYIAVLEDSADVTFSGFTHADSMSLEEGMNMITMPLDPGGEYHAREFCEKLDAHLLIRFHNPDSIFQSFIPEFHEDGGFAIRGGEGFLASVDRTHTVHLYGSGWLGERGAVPGEYMAAADGSGRAERTVIFGIGGMLLQDAWGEETPLSNEYHAFILNRSTGERAAVHIDYSTGGFAAVLIDITNTYYVHAGDTLALFVMDRAGQTVGDPIEQVATAEDISRMRMSVRAVFAGPVPAVSKLYQNFPNPFNPATTIRFQIAAPGMVIIKVFNVAGQLVKTLVNEPKKAGYYKVVWDGNNNNGNSISSGVYFCRLETPGYSRSLKMVILR